MENRCKYILWVFILILISSCSQSEKELDLSQIKNVAKIFSVALVKNDSTLFQKILLDRNEFVSLPIADKFGKTYREYSDNMKVDFEIIKQLVSKFIEPYTPTSKYGVIKTDINQDFGYIKYFFNLSFESGNKVKLKLYLIKNSKNRWKLAQFKMQ